MYVCICNVVSDSDIRQAVEDGVRNMRQLRQRTGCSSTCGCCEDMAVEVLQQALTEKRESPVMLTGLQIA